MRRTQAESAQSETQRLAKAKVAEPGGEQKLSERQRKGKGREEAKKGVENKKQSLPFFLPSNP